MLKLAMKPGDSIRIGEEIRVQLPEDVGYNVHLLVDAPREIEIKRQKREEPAEVSVKKEKVYVVKNK